MTNYTANNDFEALQNMLGRADTQFSEFNNFITVPLDNTQSNLEFEFDSDSSLLDVKIVGTESEEGVVLHLQIRNQDYGVLTTAMLENFWPGSQDLNSTGRVHINGVHGTLDEQCLYVDFKAGDRNVEDGVSWLSPLPPRAEYYYSYQVYFAENFDFSARGRLPGVGGGQPGSGFWEQVFEWGSNGIVYAVIPNQSPIILQNPDNSNFKFIPGKWHTIKARVALNTKGQSDGNFEVWVDDAKFIDQSGIFVNVSSGTLDWLSFNAFFLNSDSVKKCCICFQEFILSTAQIKD